MYATASLAAAGGGWYLHKLNRLSLMQYAGLDILMCTVQPLLIGFTRSLPLSILSMIITMAFWRFRNIIYQDQLLRHFGSSHHKATLVSIMGFFRDVQQLWLPVWFAAIITANGYYQGLSLIGGGILAVMPPVFILGIYLWRRPKTFDTATAVPTGNPG